MEGGGEGDWGRGRAHYLECDDQRTRWGSKVAVRVAEENVEDAVHELVVEFDIVEKIHHDLAPLGAEDVEVLSRTHVALVPQARVKEGRERGSAGEERTSKMKTRLRTAGSSTCFLKASRFSTAFSTR